MPGQQGDSTVLALHTASRIGVGVVEAYCVIALAGWVFDFPVEIGAAPGGPQMSAPTILCFALCGAGILLLTCARHGGRAAMLRQAASSAVLLISLYAIAGYSCSVVFGVADMAMLKAGYLFGPRMGSVAPATAFNFLSAGVALLLSEGALGDLLFAGFVTAGLSVTGLYLVGYVFGVASLYKVAQFSAMSLPTALAFVLIFSSALLAKPDTGWFARIVARDSGGAAARRLLPPILFVPIILSWLMIQAIRADWFDAPFGFAIVAIVSTIILGITTYYVSLWLGRRDIELTDEISLRCDVQGKLQIQIERLNLLNQITRAIGTHQDFPSIFRVVMHSLEEQLPVDFSGVLIHDPANHTFIVSCVGAKSRLVAVEQVIQERASINVGDSGLSRCIQGHLVYEPDIARLPYAFSRRLCKGGLNALVAAPLMMDRDVFGVFLVARRLPGSFSSSDCEFLRQLADNVGVAAHQTNLRDSLQRAYDDLRQTQQHVMQQERLHALGQMASGIAHDINNAITPVAVYTQSLLESESALSPQVRTYMETVERVVDDIGATVARMRDFYRPREPDAHSPVDLSTLVGQVVELTRAWWSDMPQQRGIVIAMTSDLDASLPPVLGMESEIREALTNLVINSVDALPEGGTINIRTRVALVRAGERPPARVVLEVSDTGVGMDRETRRKCLEPFFTTKGERGTGLGLAMVYGVANRHDADLEIESIEGQGTTIRLSFPAADVASRVVVLSKDQPPIVPQHILLIDDDPLILESMQAVLERDGHDVTAADGGKNGIEAFRAAMRGNPFAVVITDLGMPGMDGNDVARTIKALSHTTPIIMLTGWGQRMSASNGVRSQVDIVLGKPLRLGELRNALRTCAEATMCLRRA